MAGMTQKPVENKSLKDEAAYRETLIKQQKAITELLEGRKETVLSYEALQIANTIKSITPDKKIQKGILNAIDKGLDNYIKQTDKTLTKVEKGQLTVPEAEKILQRTLEASTNIIRANVRELAPNDKTDWNAVTANLAFTTIVAIALFSGLAGLSSTAVSGMSSWGGFNAVATGGVTNFAVLRLRDSSPSLTRPWRTVSEEAKDLLYDKTVDYLGLDVGARDLRMIPKKK